MTDISTHPGVSEETINEVKAVVADTKVREALAHPTVTNVINAAQDPSVHALLESVPEVVKETKAGWKTTEFWATVAALVGVNANGLILTLPDKYQGVISGALVVAYAFSRGVAKKGIPDVQPSPVAVAPAEEIVQR